MATRLVHPEEWNPDHTPDPLCSDCHGTGKIPCGFGNYGGDYGALKNCSCWWEWCPTCKVRGLGPVLWQDGEETAQGGHVCNHG